MQYRFATADDCPMLAILNHQLIQDERHGNPMNVTELEGRMHGWLTSGEYKAVIFEEQGKPAAYALFSETETEIHLRQFFVTRGQRHKGIGSHAMQKLFSDLWTNQKRWTVSVLTNNQPAVAFWHAMGYADYALTLEIMPGAQGA